ncbi:MAG: acyltransferase family protein [Alphaproteobacteria bacterium]
MPAKLDHDISQRIAIARYLMIFGIVVLHVPPAVPLSAIGSDPFALLKGFFAHGLFRTTVPVLTCISGFLLFRAGLDRRFADLLQKKVRTLLIPMIVWNAPLALALYYIQAQGLMDHQFSQSLHPFSPRTMADAVLALTGESINYPLGFLRDLFVLALLAPLLGLFIRRAPWIGLVLVIAVFWLNLDAALISRNMMPVTFYVGGLAAVRGWDLRRLDAFALPLAAATVLASAAIVVFEIRDIRLFQALAPFLIWPVGSLLAGTAAGRTLETLARHSFAIFVTHAPVLLVLWMLYQKTPAQAVPYELFWLAAPFVVAAVCHGLHAAARWLAPGPTRFALGAR